MKPATSFTATKLITITIITYISKLTEAANNALRERSGD